LGFTAGFVVSIPCLRRSRIRVSSFRALGALINRMPVSSQRRAITVEPSEACLEGCQAGNSAAVEELFRTHVGLVEHVLGRLVGPVMDLEDLTQTVFLEALRSLSRYRGDASFKTWLMSITVHVGQH